MKLKTKRISNHEIVGPMPQIHKEKPDQDGNFPRGVSNRNAGLEFVLKHAQTTGDTSGVIYFADDDNTYDLKLFDEIRKTKKVSVFPVGFVGKYLPFSSYMKTKIS